ncbi:methyl-accepting chemotaxis protein [Massilia glaciei]|uniref:Chemotaxis protein n=1 Tax=Massilia glaciei TaxID=1524097 RepID=A0A2U2HMS9_9BURK|nr:methyl-accepting chemotaxis protein [Massilia glaciei]PWF48803.1 chemotaxis protein [Massilia glaciei]
MKNLHDASQAMSARAARLMLCVLWALQLFSFALAGINDTWMLTLAVGLPAAVLPSILYRGAAGTPLMRCLVAFCLMVFAALNIHQGKGLTELHFGIFVYLAFLLAYFDWRPIVVAALTIALHHLSFHYLQQWQYALYCFTRPQLSTVFIHVAYVVAEAGVLIFLANILRRAARQAAELEGIVSALAAVDGRIDLSAADAEPPSRLARSLLAMLATIRDAVAGMREGATSIAGTSAEIAHGNAELSRRTDRQAGSIEQTVASMARLAATVDQHNESARQANALAHNASGVALKGGEAVREVVATMGKINASSRQIVDIISVIDGIAFQTNILALNAAVEAARAGEQGRGFAVVAAEVRILAHRSAAAAKEIKELIGNTVQTVESGSRLVDEAGSTMLQVVDSVQRVTAIMAEMSNASQQQNDGIARINQAIVEFDENTQHNAALVQEVAAAADALADEAQHLTSLVAAFKLETGPATQSLPQAAPLAPARRQLEACRPVPGGISPKNLAQAWRGAGPDRVAPSAPARQ